jgi:hypothetical protein
MRKTKKTKKTKETKETKETKAKSLPQGKKLLRNLSALDEENRQRFQKYDSFLESIQVLPTSERAEAWLSYVSSNMDSFGDQEALVYLASRGTDCARQIAAMIARWKNEERRRISACAEGIRVYNLDNRRSKKILTRRARLRNFRPTSCGIFGLASFASKS